MPSISLEILVTGEKSLGLYHRIIIIILWPMHVTATLTSSNAIPELV